MITFTRNHDGSYARAGEVPKSARRVRVEIARGRAEGGTDAFDDGMGAEYTPNDALRLLETGAARGLLRYRAYRVVPVETAGDARMTDETTALLDRARFYRKLDKMTDAQVCAIVAWG